MLRSVLLRRHISPFILSNVDAVEFYNMWMDIGQQPTELKVSESYIEIIIVAF